MRVTLESLPDGEEIRRVFALFSARVGASEARGWGGERESARARGESARSQG